MEKTIEVGKRLIATDAPPAADPDFSDDEIYHIADLSCGDATIAKELARGVVRRYGAPVLAHLGDFAPGYEYTGPIEETVEQIPNVDLFVFSESAEHLDQPDAILRRIREKSSKLLVSTPACSWPDPNPEHYHSWDAEAFRGMLIDAGWSPRFYESFQHRLPDGSPLGYTYQIYGCE